MTDQLSVVKTALRGDSALMALVSNRIYRFLPTKPFESPTITFSQVNNIGMYSFGNVESLEDFLIQIAVYTKIGSESIDIVIAADTVMKSLGYQRQSATEFLDNDKNKAVAIYRKLV